MASTHDVEAAELQRDIEQTRASLEKHIGTLAGEIRSTVNRASSVTDALAANIDKAISVADAIKLHPYRSLLVATLAGGVLGGVWGRYRRSQVAGQTGRPQPCARSSMIVGLLEPELATLRARAVDALVDGIRAFFVRSRKKSR
jgi:hypothetical protein